MMQQHIPGRRLSRSLFALGTLIGAAARAQDDGAAPTWIGCSERNADYVAVMVVR